MPTQKPLKQLIPDILRQIDKYREYTKFQERIYRILQGQIKDEVECSIKKEIISPGALKRMLERIPPINILRKTSDKLSEVYTEPPSRLLDKPGDQEIIDSLSKIMYINKQLELACGYLIAQHTVAVEPYVHEGNQRLRVLSAHQYLPFSDDPVDPTQMTVFIKFMGTEDDFFFNRFDKEGELIDKTPSIDRPNNIYALFSDKEFLVIDRQGKIREDITKIMGIEGTVNSFGIIPQSICRKPGAELVPFPNQEGYDISVLIPKLLTDLNFSAQFLTHSIIWSRNTDLDGQQINPDAVVDLGTGDKEEGMPEIGVIQPHVDIDQQLKLIDYQLTNHFNSLGMKLSSNSIMSNGRDSSAIGKAVDESDTTSVRKKLQEKFRIFENEVWFKIFIMQEVWVQDGQVIENRLPSLGALDSLSISFAEIRPVKTRRQLLDELKEMRALRVITREQIIREMKPELTDAQVKKWIEAVEEEEKEAMEAMLMGGPSPFPERTPEGTFAEGNTAAGNQDETSKTEENNDERA